MQDAGVDKHRWLREMSRSVDGKVRRC